MIKIKTNVYMSTNINNVHICVRVTHITETTCVMYREMNKHVRIHMDIDFDIKNMFSFIHKQ